jgi:hypothetical protein
VRLAGGELTEHHELQPKDLPAKVPKRRSEQIEALAQITPAGPSHQTTTAAHQPASPITRASIKAFTVTA